MMQSLCALYVENSSVREVSGRVRLTCSLSEGFSLLWIGRKTCPSVWALSMGGDNLVAADLSSQQC